MSVWILNISATVMRFPHLLFRLTYRVMPSSGPVKPFAAAALTATALDSICGEEACGLFGELFIKLKVRAVPGIRIKDQPSIRQMLLKDVGIDGRHHDVVLAVDDERALLDRLQIAVAVGRGDHTPFSQSHELSLGDLGPRFRLAV